MAYYNSMYQKSIFIQQCKFYKWKKKKNSSNYNPNNKPPQKNYGYSQQTYKFVHLKQYITVEKS